MLAGVGLGIGGQPVFGQDFQVSVAEANWQSEASEQGCVMEQTIAPFGAVRFTQNKGEPLEFALTVPAAYQPISRATLSVLASPWQADAYAPRHFQVYPRLLSTASGSQLVVFGQDAEAIVQGLLTGRTVMFAFYYAAYEARVTVAARPTGFRQAQRMFSECRQALVHNQ
ncbi:MAG: hypothetical protein RQ715_03425 [Methylococcales bacterium]|nr:hypothetical protein [Methylococcales bacterium]